MSVKSVIKLLCPSLIWGIMHRVRSKVAQKKAIKVYQKHYSFVEQRIRKKSGPLNVLFMAIYDSNWKYDSVYNEMLNDPIFNSLILICPVINKGKEHMVETMNKCSRTFEKKGYKYVRTYDEKTDSYVDAHDYNPDIIFYTNPYDWLIDERYYFDKFPDSLICYVNYAYNNHIHEWGFNLKFHKYLWRYYVECDPNYKLIKSCSPIHARNCRITGYPMYDEFMAGTKTGRDWKLNDIQHKRIIWSPHHTIDGCDELLKFSTFLLYHEEMLKLADRYKDKIEIAFKPHPLLKVNLYEHPEWGKERTDRYYKQWLQGQNTTLVEGEYIDLFNSSDAMINDSGSFLIEYLYMQKPCLYLNNYNRQEGSNEAALNAFNCWYHATTEEEIERFVEDVVISGMDIMKEKREKFYKEVLLPPNGCTVAENIINDIRIALMN